MSPGHSKLTVRSADDCQASREILDRVGDKWSIFIVVILNTGPKRFNELKRSIGIVSQRMLTLTLRGLERDGLVKRTVTPTIPPRVDYELTRLGYTLVSAIEPLVKWADRTRQAVEKARVRFDQRHQPDSEKI
jgi:DNA-binding HxlR family transcriptional regulator